MDRDYVSALATADHFLHAWQNRDQENGIFMLTDNVKSHASEDRLENFFSAGPGAAYEISRGKKIKTGRYSFPVTLFGVYGASPKKSLLPRHSEIVVVRTGKDDWIVDKLP